MTVTIIYPLGLTGITGVTATAVADGAGDAAGTTLTFSEYGTDLGTYSAPTTLAAGLYKLQILIGGSCYVPQWANIPSTGSCVTTDMRQVQIDYTQISPLTYAAGTVGAAIMRLIIDCGRLGTLQAGTTNGGTLDSGATTVAGSYVGTRIITIGGTGGAPPGHAVDSTHFTQTRTITSYNPSSKAFTVDRPWAIVPDNTTQFLLIEATKADLYLALGNLQSVDAAGVLITDSIANITIPASVVQSLQSAGTIPCVRGDQLSRVLPLLGTITSRTQLVFTAKLPSIIQNASNTDSQAILQVVEGTGLTILNGSTSGVTAAWGSLTVTNATTGSAILSIAASATSQIPIEDLLWDCQWIDGSGNVTTPINGTFSISADVTQAIS